MAIIRNEPPQPIWRPTPSQPRPGVTPMPPMGPHPIGAAIRLACTHAALHPLQQYFQVMARIAAVEVSIQSDTFATQGAFWAKYGHEHKRANDYQSLVVWIEQRDRQMVAEGVLTHWTLDQDIWWVVPYPRLPDMATLVEG